MKKYNILVTGVGAIIGYGVIASLRKSRYDCNIVGMDIFYDAAGQVWCDEFVQAILAVDKNYIPFLKEQIDKYNKDMKENPTVAIALGIPSDGNSNGGETVSYKVNSQYNYFDNDLDQDIGDEE